MKAKSNLLRVFLLTAGSSLLAISSSNADNTWDGGGNTGALAFTVGDGETAFGSLTVIGTSSNTGLVPNANIVFGGSGASRTFTKRGAPYGGDLTYIIETSETLDSGSWSDEVTHGPSLLISSPTISYTFTPGSPVKKFARLEVVATP